MIVALNKGIMNNNGLKVIVVKIITPSRLSFCLYYLDLNKGINSNILIYSVYMYSLYSLRESVLVSAISWGDT